MSSMGEILIRKCRIASNLLFMKITYRPEIDGLRAISVLSVVLFHAGFGCSGGFVGVDVFFVISGFLITRIILKDMDAGVFSLKDFWLRRIRRILPASVTMVLTVLVIGAFVLDLYEHVFSGRSEMPLYSEKALYRDHTHLSRSGAQELIVPVLRDCFKEIATQRPTGHASRDSR
jgi:hypothetical protein